MRFGFNFGLLGGNKGGHLPNACMNEGSNGTKYGFLDGSFGSFDPGFTIDGHVVHELSWQADGTFIMSFGTNGDEEITNISEIHISNNNHSLTLIWDAANKIYTISDVPTATALIGDYVDGQQYCMFIYTDLPKGLIIDYIFNTIRRA